ncbi:MAG: O-sialoglycoprotein endopeptidase [Bacillota bacterium]|nr:O-sialoglycoprotein endopeptidase [Bacillota bacterium]MDI7248486.1 O-sialoglycoprotein endopeptidase [Bacillota bacterium]
MIQGILALDTSCYTTSCALVEASGRARADLRLPLPVPPGGRGLRQAEAVFHHLVQLPRLVERVMEVARREDVRVTAVAASTRPRPPRDSYLPVFRAGEGFGRAVAAALGVPFVELSHQEGHLGAVWNPGLPDTVLALHVSGGTTELLRLQGGAAREAVSLGTSLDLHAGQFLDRVGVAMGLPFPAGAHLDRLAMAASDDREASPSSAPGASGGPTSPGGQPGGAPEVAIPVTVRGYRPSFAGPEAAALRLIAQGTAPALVARAALLCVARALEKMVLAALEAGEPPVVLVVGGVAASALVRDRLRHRLGHPAVGVRLHFPPPELCTDNAVGVGRWAAGSPLRKGLDGDGVE